MRASSTLFCSTRPSIFASRDGTSLFRLSALSESIQASRRIAVRRGDACPAPLSVAVAGLKVLLANSGRAALYQRFGPHRLWQSPRRAKGGALGGRRPITEVPGRRSNRPGTPEKIGAVFTCS
jgi:hypothetical protein